MDSKAIMDKLRSIAQGTGLFAAVLTHEPKSAPALDGPPTLALFTGPITPSGEQSGLNSASVRWQVNGRVYRNGFSEPADDIDPDLIDCSSLFLAALAGSYTLGGLIRCIDLYGMAGEPLKGEAGYLEADKKIYRCMELEIPLLVNDVWELAP